MYDYCETNGVPFEVLQKYMSIMYFFFFVLISLKNNIELLSLADDILIIIWTNS